MIACHYYRRIIRNSLDADQSLPERAQNHIQACPHCREVYEAELGTVRALRGAPVKESSSAFLHARIMWSLDRGQTREVQSPWPRLGWAVGVAAVCVIVLAVGWARQRSRTMARARATQIAMQIDRDLSLIKKLPDGDQVGQWAGKLDEPLETEKKLVINDAKTALNALADSFLPSKVRQSLFEQDKGS